jgi:hypothetical protein
MKPKFILCLALVLSGIFATQRAYSYLPLYVHFGVASRDPANRLLSARINLGEGFFVGGDDFDELKGHIEQRGTNLVADLMGSTGQQGQFYRGDMTLEKPFFGQGGVASGGMGVVWFAISTNSDCETILEHVNAVMGFTNAPFSHPDATPSPSVISNAPKNIDPATGLPWGNRFVDPITGLPVSPKHDKQP